MKLPASHVASLPGPCVPADRVGSLEDLSPAWAGFPAFGMGLGSGARAAGMVTAMLHCIPTALGKLRQPGVDHQQSISHACPVVRSADCSFFLVVGRQCQGRLLFKWPRSAASQQRRCKNTELASCPNLAHAIKLVIHHARERPLCEAHHPEHQGGSAVGMTWNDITCSTQVDKWVTLRDTPSALVA